MLKHMIIVSLLFLYAIANDAPATKSDIQMILKVMEANNKSLQNQINSVRVDLQNQINSVRVDLQNQINSVRVDLQNQIKATNKRIDDTNNYILALMGGIFVLVGFIYWDRRTMISKAKEEMSEKMEFHLEKKADHDKLEKIFNILKDFAKKNKDFQETLNKHLVH